MFNDYNGKERERVPCGGGEFQGSRSKVQGLLFMLKDDEGGQGATVY